MQPVLDQLVHLPIMADLPAIDVFFAANSHAVAIVAMDHHAGKSTLLPAYLASRIDHSVQGPIVVLKHHTWQAIQAAEQLSRLNDSRIGTAVSHLTSAGKKVNIEASQVVFSTYTYALFSGLIAQAKTVVMDDTDIETLDLTLSKLVLQSRAAHGDKLHVVLLTPGVAELEGWAHWPHIIAEEHTRPTPSCRNVTGSVSAAVMTLLTDHQGILVFAADTKQATDAHDQIVALLDARDPGAPSVLVSRLDDGVSPSAEQTAAWAAPVGGSKVVIGCGLVMHAPELEWVTAGVSTGITLARIEVRTTGGVAEMPVLLTQQELLRQMHRVHGSTFMLCHNTPFEGRPIRRQAECHRLPPAILMIRCAALQVDPNMLDFHAHTPDGLVQQIFTTKRYLQQLGLITPATTGKFALTQAGKIAHHLSDLGPETAALLGHAALLDVTASALVLAVACEIGWVRKDRSVPHGLDTSSDLFDTAKAIAVGLHARTLSSDQRSAVLTAHNIDSYRLRQSAQILRTLESNFRCHEDSWKIYLPTCPHDTTALFAKLRQCVLAASINTLGSWIGKSKVQFGDGLDAETFEPSRGTAAVWHQTSPVAATKRLINPRSGGSSFSVVDAITTFEFADFEAVNVTIVTAGRDPLFSVHRGHDRDQIILENDSILGTMVYRGPSSVVREPAAPTPRRNTTPPVFVLGGHDKTTRLVNAAKARKRAAAKSTVQETVHTLEPTTPTNPDIAAAVLAGERASRDALQALAAHFNH